MHVKLYEIRTSGKEGISFKGKVLGCTKANHNSFDSGELKTDKGPLSLNPISFVFIEFINKTVRLIFDWKLKDLAVSSC